MTPVVWNESLSANKIESAVTGPTHNLDLIASFYNSFSTALSILCLLTRLQRELTPSELRESPGPKPEPRIRGLAEMQHEGDEQRIANGMFYRRFFRAPWVPGNETVNLSEAANMPRCLLGDTTALHHRPVPGNDTVDWSQASIITRYSIDDTRLYHIACRYLTKTQATDVELPPSLNPRFTTAA